MQGVWVHRRKGKPTFFIVRDTVECDGLILQRREWREETTKAVQEENKPCPAGVPVKSVKELVFSLVQTYRVILSELFDTKRINLGTIADLFSWQGRWTSVLINKTTCITKSMNKCNDGTATSWVRHGQAYSELRQVFTPPPPDLLPQLKRSLHETPDCS